ncbi:MAG: recombinase family protein, partial [Balneolaceae bacterium]
LMGEIQRAYQESNRKSERLTDARKREREQARNGQRKISGMAPMWLELSKDKKEFIPIPEVVEVIHLIFQMKLNGKGTHRIEKELNQMDDIFVPTHKRNKSNAWAKGTINRYLRDTRLIGEYQPHKYIKVEDEETGMEKRIRVIAGSVIADYYPTVIDRSLFFQVQEILNANSNPEKGNHGGRNGEESNLFTYIATCGYCGSSLHYMNKGKWEYLQCESQRRGLGCTEHKPLRYDNGFEPFILKLCKELNPSDILPGDEQQQSRLAVLQNHLQSVNGELAGLEKEQKNLRDTIRRTTSSETRMLYDQDLQEIINKQGALKQQTNQITEEINQIQTSTRNTRKRLEDIRELIDYMENLKGKARIDLRIKLKLRLRQLIENISIKTGDQIQLAIQFTTDRELIYWIDQNGQVDVHDSEHSAEKQRESDSKVASALRKNKG